MPRKEYEDVQINDRGEIKNSFYLFKEKEQVAASEGQKRTPDYTNAKVVFEVSLEPGRYSFSGWQYPDTGNISIKIQKVTEVSDGGGFDD